MPLLLSSSCFTAPCHFPRSKRNFVSTLDFVRYRIPSNFCRTFKCKHRLLKIRPSTIPLKCAARDFVSTDYDSSEDEGDSTFVWGDEGEIGDDTGSPWEGAVVYRRNPSISHIEYCTTLERLGMGNLSTDVSKSRASGMGLRVTKAVKDYPLGTPVQISIDVTRKKQKLRIDGIVKTVLTLRCNRCGDPAAESIFSNFSLLLTEEPIDEPEVINLGSIFGEDKLTNGDDEASIDMDDWLYFPPEVKEIDISKHIRDLVHIEITINALCDPSCKGLCLKCGVNFNTNSCSCSKEDVLKEKGLGPLRNLKKQMQEK